MSTDESQGDAAWRLLNALPVGHASTASVSSEGGSGSQSQLLLPSVEVPVVDAYRGFGLAGDSMEVDIDTDEQAPEQGGGTQQPDSVFKRPFLPFSARSQPQPPPIQQAIASSSRAATQQPKSPIPIPKTRRAPSPEPESQDSFAQPTGSQEMKRFVRDNRGRLAQLMAEAEATAGGGRASPESSQTQSSSSAGDRSREIPDPVVLVAGTPSQSQSQSQPKQHGQQQSQNQNPNQDEDDDDDDDDEYTRGAGQDSQVLSNFTPILDPSMLLDEAEHENPRSEDSFDARVQQEEEEDDENGPLVATQIEATQQATQPQSTAAPSTGLSEQAERMLRSHPRRFQELRRGLRATDTSNMTNTTHPSNLTNVTNPSTSTHITADTGAADRAFVQGTDVTQQDDVEGTPPPGPPIETQLQSPPRTAPRKRTIPSARSTQQKPATGTASASVPSLPSPQTPQRALPAPAPDPQQHSSPATNNMSNSNPSQAYSSSVVPGSIASEVSAPPMRRPPPSVFQSPSVRREQDDEIVPDSAAASSFETPSSQPVPLAQVVARRREMEAANTMAGLAQGAKKGPVEEKGVTPVQQVGKENEISSLASDTSLGLKRQPPTKRRYGGRKGGEEHQAQAMPPPNINTLEADDEDEDEMDVDDAPQIMLPSSLTRPQQRAASPEAVPEPFPGEEDISVTSPSEGEGDPDPESQPPVKAGSPRRKKRPAAARRSPTVEAIPPPVRRVVKGKRIVEPMISIEAITEAESAPPTQQRPKRSLAATRVRRASAATALKNLKESDDDESAGDGGYEDESYRETQYTIPLRDPTPPARTTRRASGKKTAPPSAPATQTQTQTQTRNLKRRRASDGQTQNPSQGRKRAKLEEPAATAPTVYALYSDQKFYPAIVTGVAGLKYAVVYSDGTPGFVSLAGLRAGPAVGDTLQLVDRKKMTATVLEFNDVELRVSVGPDGEVETVSWSDVCRTKAMAGSVALTAEQVDALRQQDEDDEKAVSFQRTRTDSPHLAARKRSPSDRFKGLAFVLTCHPQSRDRAWRTEMPSRIDNAEGTVLNDWTDVMSYGPRPTDNGRWSATAADLVPLENADQRVFVLTDVPVMTPKYLMALALGLPCVSKEWADDVLTGAADADQWHSYMPSAGLSTDLGIDLSQVVECDADGKIPTVREALAEDGWARKQRQRRRPFTGKSMLFVGEVLLPTDEMKFAGQRSLPPVCLAMGASEVEAVRDFAHTSARRFDIVVIQESMRPSPSPSDIRARLAVNGLQGTPPWVKQCLIAGRLLDPSRATA